MRKNVGGGAIRMRVLVLGGTGMLGHKLVQVLGSRFDVWATVRQPSFADIERFAIFDPAKTVVNLDVEDQDRLSDAITTAKPDVVINAIGLIKQIDEAGDPDKLFMVNAELPQRLAELANRTGYRFITLSTDCVFSGKKGNYTEADEPDATDDYGRSKLAGEVTGPNSLTIRTSMIGRELETEHSLVEWFLAHNGGHVRGYVNAIYSGFPTIVLSRLIGDIISHHHDLNGVYHVSSDPISKFELLQLINRHFASDIEVEPDGEFVIDRSLDSTRFRNATGFTPATWDAMVEMMASDPTPYATWHMNK